MLGGEGKALQFTETEPPAAAEAKTHSHVSLDLYFLDLCEPTHPHQNIRDNHFLWESFYLP